MYGNDATGKKQMIYFTIQKQRTENSRDNRSTGSRYGINDTFISPRRAAPTILVLGPILQHRTLYDTYA